MLGFTNLEPSLVDDHSFMYRPKHAILLLLYWVLPAFPSLAHDSQGKLLKRFWTYSLFTEDVYEQLSCKWFHDPLTKRLLDFIFLPPTTFLASPDTTSWNRYQGKIIGDIQLYRSGVFEPKLGDTKAGKRRKALGGIFSPTTRRWVIYNYLSFDVGDRLDKTKLASDQKELKALPYLKEARISVAPSAESNDTVDVLVTTQDNFPIALGLDLDRLVLTINHQNVGGWGHALVSQCSYDTKWGYGFTYQVPNIQGSHATGELQYLNAPKKQVKRLGVYKNFGQPMDYAGAAEISYTKLFKERLLDGATNPTPITYGFHYQNLWLGRAFQRSLEEDKSQKNFFLTARLSHQAFAERPTVGKDFNRAFHGHTFVVGSGGIAHQHEYQARFVYDVGRMEAIPGGVKVSLTGGYQLGEFVSRPYWRFDVAQAGLRTHLGYLYTSFKLGGFLHNQAMEQWILGLAASYFTPLLPMGSHAIRQFIELNYLAGFNMFTGELISTHTKRVPKGWADPFPAGTKRFKLHLETVLWPARQIAGCQVAVLGFVDAVTLQTSSHTMPPSSFCEALGMGLRVGHERFALGTLQLQVGYRPILQGMELSVSSTMRLSPDDLAIDEPGTIAFHQY